MLACGLVSGAVAAPTMASAFVADDAEVASSFVKFTVKAGDHAYEHPGFDVYHDEHTLLEIKSGSIKYKFDVMVSRKKDDGPYHVEFELFKNGVKVITHQEMDVKPRKLIVVKGVGGIELDFSVDPAGALDKSRKDKAKLKPDSDDPLG